jgi:beta-galactosidase
MIALCAALTMLTPIAMIAANAGSPRLDLAADSGWKFVLGDPSGAEASSFLDQAWRTVQLPHDWSIESAPDKSNPSGSGGGFFPNGTGWYRKVFSAPLAWKGKRVKVQFDGIYRNATIYLNGHKLGSEPYGYTSFELDLTPELRFTDRNVLAVRVDNSAQPNSRWYTGSGIYRHVRVVVTDPTHVAHWGVFITTPEVSEMAAKVQVRTTVANESNATAGVTVQTTLLDRSGQTSELRSLLFD